MWTEADDSHPNEPEVEVAVYMKDDFHERAGRTPEDMAVQFLTRAFEKAEINYQVHYGLPPQTGIQDRQSVCGPQFHQWNSRVVDGNVEYVAKDSNVLLLDRRGGGCGQSIACSTGVETFDEPRPYDLEGGDEFWRSVNVVLHEVGHNLGFSHDPDGGYGFNHDGRWHRTPTVGSNDVDNLCGEFTEDRLPDHDSYRYAFYHWCAVVNFDIADDSRDPSPPETYPPEHDGDTVELAHRFPEVPDPVNEVDVDMSGTTGNVGEVHFEYNAENDGVAEIEADIEFSADGNSETVTETIPAGDETGSTTHVMAVPTDSEINVAACVAITDARYT